MDSVLASHPAALGLIPGVPQKNSEKKNVHAALFNLLRAVDSRGLTNLIKPI